jgi:hypothetical protein
MNHIKWIVLLALPIAFLTVLIGWLWVPAIIQAGKVIFLMSMILIIIYSIIRLLSGKDKSLSKRLSMALSLIASLIVAGVAIFADGYIAIVIAFIAYALAGVVAIKGIVAIVK